jgi:hypothetical protein
MKNTLPITLADSGYVSCTHQNSQEGRWRHVKRGTCCGATGDELQSLGIFVGNLVTYTFDESEEHSTRPQSFIHNPAPSKVEWDFLHDFNPKQLFYYVPQNLSGDDIHIYHCRHYDAEFFKITHLCIKKSKYCTPPRWLALWNLERN